MRWDISRGVIAAIEGGVRCVTDTEFVNLARALNIPLEALLPDKVRRQVAGSTRT